MALKTLSALARIALLATLTLVLASCGGGSTAEPVPQAGVATTTSSAPPGQPQSTTAPPATTTRPTATTPAVRPTPRPRGSRSRSSGGVAVPSAPSGDAGEPAPRPAGERAADPQPATMLLDERATLTLTRRVTAAHYFQQGTVTGTYDGTMAVEARITSKGVLVRFTATLPGGTITGRGVAVAILDSTSWPGLRGRAIITGGSGRFARIQGRRLRVTGRAKPDASRAHVRLAGMVSLD